MPPPDAIVEDVEGAPRVERRAGVTLGRRTAVTVSVALVLQAAYGVYMLGRTAEKLDAVVDDVREIKRAQYTRADADRDMAPLRRDGEKIEVRIRDLERRIGDRQSPR